MSTSRNVKAKIKELAKNKKQEKELLEFASKLTGSDEDKVRLIQEELKKNDEQG